MYILFRGLQLLYHNYVHTSPFIDRALLLFCFSFDIEMRACSLLPLVVPRYDHDVEKLIIMVNERAVIVG